MLVKIRWIYPVGILLLSAVLLLCVARSREQDEPIRIGIPDGAAGLLVRYVLDEKLGRQVVRDVRFEPYTLYDCCGSASHYAMGSGRLDVAILCPDAARELVQKDGSFEITGPMMMNSDILITRANAHLSHPRIAVSQKREFQREMVLKHFGNRGTAVPMFHGAVPFAFAKNVVQGAVIDITKAFALEGEISPAGIAGEDVCTYVLVNKKSIRKSAHFHQLLERYREAVREMEDADNLLRLMQTYVSADITTGEVRQWKKMNVRFICPSNFPLHE